MTPEQVKIGEWVWSGVMVMGAFWIGLQIVGWFKRKPAIEAEFATKSELNAVRTEAREAVTRAEYGSFQGQVTGQLAELRGQLNTGFVRLAEKLENFAADVSLQLRRETDTLHDRVTEVAKKVERIDERTGN